MQGDHFGCCHIASIKPRTNGKLFWMPASLTGLVTSLLTGHKSLLKPVYFIYRSKPGKISKLCFIRILSWYT